jgi:hypothetical protein
MNIRKIIKIVGNFYHFVILTIICLIILNLVILLSAIILILLKLI